MSVFKYLCFHEHHGMARKITDVRGGLLACSRLRRWDLRYGKTDSGRGIRGLPHGGSGRRTGAGCATPDAGRGTWNKGVGRCGAQGKILPPRAGAEPPPVRCGSFPSSILTFLALCQEQCKPTPVPPSKFRKRAVKGSGQGESTRECGSLLPLSARQLAGRPARKQASGRKAGASSRTPHSRDFDGTPKPTQ